MFRLRILPIVAVLFVTICLFHIDETLPVDEQSCFFMDGVPICGEEGRLARLKHEEMLKKLINDQVHHAMPSRKWCGTSINCT